MIEVIEQTDKLVDTFKNADFYKKMISLKKEINDKHLINTDDVKRLYQNPIIHEYVENQNILDMHIYYLNKKIQGLIDNKVCK